MGRQEITKKHLDRWEIGLESLINLNRQGQLQDWGAEKLSVLKKVETLMALGRNPALREDAKTRRLLAEAYSVASDALVESKIPPEHALVAIKSTRFELEKILERQTGRRAAEKPFVIPAAERLVRAYGEKAKPEVKKREAPFLTALIKELEKAPARKEAAATLKKGEEELARTTAAEKEKARAEAKAARPAERAARPKILLVRRYKTWKAARAAERAARQQRVSLMKKFKERQEAAKRAREARTVERAGPKVLLKQRIAGAFKSPAEEARRAAEEARRRKEEQAKIVTEVPLPRVSAVEEFERLPPEQQFRFAKSVLSKAPISMLIPPSREFWERIMPEEKQAVVDEFKAFLTRGVPLPKPAVIVPRKPLEAKMLPRKPFEKALRAALEKEEKQRMLELKEQAGKKDELEKLRKNLGLMNVREKLREMPEEAKWLEEKIHRATELKTRFGPKAQFKRLLMQTIKMKAGALAGELPTQAQKQKLEKNICRLLKSRR